jgi:hypothetical protein
MPIWKNLRDEDPDDRALADGMRGDEGKDARGHDAEVLGEKRPRAQPERRDVAERADDEQRAPSEPVDEPEARKREEEIRDANADGLQQRGLRTESGHFKNARRKVEHRIDAGELVKKGDQEGEQDRHAMFRAPEAVRASCVMFRSR